MKSNSLDVQIVIIVRQYKNIGLTTGLEAYHMPSGTKLPQRYYNGRIAFQHKKLRVGLTTLRKQKRCAIAAFNDIKIILMCL